MARLAYPLTGVVSPRGLLFAGWLITLIVILCAGLKSPREFRGANGAHWLRDRKGIGFNSPGIVYTREPFKQSLNSVDKQNASAYAIEIIVAPRKNSTDHIAQILSDDDTGRSPNFLLAQWRSGLVLRAKFKTAADSRMHEIGIAEVFHAGGIAHIAIISAPTITTMYINGESGVSFAGALDVDQFSGHLLLGNSGNLSAPWLGDIVGLTFYNGQVSEPELTQDWREGNLATSLPATTLYPFSEKTADRIPYHAMPGKFLEMPTKLVMVHHNILRWDLHFTRNGMLDVVVNVLGFLPFGMLSAACLQHLFRLSGWRAGSIAVLAAAFLSFGIEFAQAYIPGRSSSSTDLLMNTVGAALGVLAWVASGGLRRATLEACAANRLRSELTVERVGPQDHLTPNTDALRRFARKWP